MAFIVGAIIGGTIAAAGAVIGANKQAGAAKQAGALQRDAADQSIREERRQYDLTRQDLRPQIAAGNRARSVQEQMLYGSAFQPQGQPQGQRTGIPNQTFSGRPQNPNTYTGGGRGGTNYLETGTYGDYGNSIAANGYLFANEQYGGPQPNENVNLGDGQEFIPGNVNTPTRDYENRVAPQVPSEQLAAYGEFEAPDYSLEAFKESPGYQFQLDEGMRAINARNSASGSYFSGKPMREIGRYATGLADQEYGDWYNRTRSNSQDQWQNQLRGYDITSGIYGQETQNFLGEYGRDAGEFSDYFNRLGGLSGSGGSASSNLATLGANSVGNQSAARLSGASDYGNALIYGGAASASGVRGVGNAIGSGLQQWGQAGFPSGGGGGSNSWANQAAAAGVS